MSFVTFVRDYVQDPNRIVHIPTFIFDACKESLWYIFSFQWFRNFTYITLDSPSFAENLHSDSLASLKNTNVFSFPSCLLSKIVNTHNLSEQLVPKIINPTQELESITPSFAEAQSSLLSHGMYGFINGITSTFCFCAVSVVVFHVLLNENKNRAFRMCLAHCVGDVSYITFVIFGFRNLIIPWLTLEPLGYILSLTIQLFFALAIIKDNRKIKARAVINLGGSSSDLPRGNYKQESSVKGTTNFLSTRKQFTGFSETPSGQLSHDFWMIPSLFLFGWCERGGIFQSLASLGGQPSGNSLQTALLTLNTSNEVRSQISFDKSVQLQTFIYLLVFFVTRIIFTQIMLSILEKLIEWKDNTNLSFLNQMKGGFAGKDGEKKGGTYFLRQSFRVLSQIVLQSYVRVKNTALHLLSTLKFNIFARNHNVRSASVDSERAATTDLMGGSRLTTIQSGFAYETAQIPLKTVLRDPIAIAAVTCSLAFLPAYSTNLLLTKSVGFFPEENRISHSLFSPWDMPGQVLGSEMEHVSHRTNENNFPEYSFFLPFYDKGDYGGWLGVGEEDVRYSPFYLWRSRRIRAPWKRTTLQEPASVFTNDKSLFTNPNFNAQQKETTNIKQAQPLFQRKSLLNVAPNTVELSSLFPASESPLATGTERNNKYTVLRTRLTAPVLIKFNAHRNFSTGGGDALQQTNGKPSPSPLVTATAAQVTKQNNKKDFRVSKEGRKKLIAIFKRPGRVKAQIIKSLKTENTGSGIPLFFARSKLQSKKPDPSRLTSVTPGEVGQGVAGDFLGVKHDVGYPQGLLRHIFGEAKGKGMKNKIARIKGVSKRVREKKFLKRMKKRFQFFKWKDRKKSVRKAKYAQHLHIKYLKLKKRKRRKLGKLIPKFRRQYPSIRNLKERKLNQFGFFRTALDVQEKQLSSLEEVIQNKPVSSVNQDLSSLETSENNALEIYREQSRPLYWKGYPKKRDSINSKEDLNLVFRSQISEDLDFAQEEIQARMFLNPYIRFILNFRVDNFLSREKSAQNRFSYLDKPSSGKSSEMTEFTKNTPQRFGLDKFYKKKADQSLTLEGEQALFKRRFIISKYADTVNFLKPTKNHSYTDRLYNHQFKGTLSTARRLFSLKIKYDQPLVHSLDYQPAIENEDLMYKESTFTKNNLSRLFEKSCLTPLYVAWEPESRKLIYTNRYLNYRKTFSSFDGRSSRNDPSSMELNTPLTVSKQKIKSAKDSQLFTNWPLKESYFKNNEFFFSQLYSNSQPIDSYLSQENEKARPVGLPRRVTSLNTALNTKSKGQPTNAQNSQKFLRLERNDKKVFLFKHLWNPAMNKRMSQDSMGFSTKTYDSVKLSTNLPASAEQLKITGMEDREYPLWMVFRTLPANQGGFLWPGD